ncbi:MAG: hypothetical protein KGY99_06095 [Phycisphaerae bacterium]|nr:hypothetical protein [Phycisphaerae bacterium]
MTSTERAILEDAYQALAASGLFAATSIGDGGASNAVPRASVTFEGRDVFISDDRPDMLWMRLRLRVVVHDRAADAADGAGRLAALSAAAGEALLADAYRSGLCRDLPVGRATEIASADPVAARRPEVEVALRLRCHFETQEGAP